MEVNLNEGDARELSAELRRNNSVNLKKRRSVLAMNEAVVASRAKGLIIRSLPAMVFDGQLANCCAERGPNEASLRAAGIGQPIECLHFCGIQRLWQGDVNEPDRAKPASPDP